MVIKLQHVDFIPFGYNLDPWKIPLLYLLSLGVLLWFNHNDGMLMMMMVMSVNIICVWTVIVIWWQRWHGYDDDDDDDDGCKHNLPL